MKKYLILALVLVSCVAYAAENVVTLKSVQTVIGADNNRYKLITWSVPTMYAVSTTACTLNLITDSKSDKWFGNSKFTLYANFRTNNSDATADSGDILIRLKVAGDSSGYYWPVADSAHMINANGRMKQYTDMTAADSIYTYTAWNIDAPAQSGGVSLALPLNLPTLDQISYKRMQLIFLNSKTKAGDSGTISKAYIIEKRPVVLTGSAAGR